jgi:hypothetical protein
VHQLVNKYIFLSIVITFVIFSFPGCEKEYDAVIDTNSSIPAISDAVFSPSIVNTDTINVAGQAMRYPTDLLTIRCYAKIRVVPSSDHKETSIVGYSLNNFQFSSSLKEGALHDDGVMPDIVANDSIYSGYVDFQIQRVIVGTFLLNIWSENSSGYKSNTIILPLQIVRLNHPPVISNLTAPDTVKISQQGSFSISLKAVDPDGYQDIKSVLRYTPSGKVLALSAINDSIYYETVSLIPPPSLGSYLFSFRAFDGSNDSSNVLTKTIVVAN